ncbi:MAG: serine/threonine-protein kinase [Planctomycetota bacterium]
MRDDETPGSGSQAKPDPEGAPDADKTARLVGTHAPRRGAGAARRDSGSTVDATSPASDPLPPAGSGPTSAETQGLRNARVVRLGKFQIEEKVGEGGMGIVYRAYDPDLHRDVAIKKIHPRFAGDEEYARRFLTEARSVAATVHPNIAQIFSIHADEPGCPPYFVMEYVEGESLDKLVRREGPLRLAVAVDIALQAARGLRAAHQKGIIHRDVKPSNILLTQRGVAKLVDFGLARRTEEVTSLTQVGIVLGTPHYVSPEQGRGRDVDLRSDIYSLGCTLFYFVTGREPFQHETKVEIIVAHANEPPPLASTSRPEIPAALDQLLLRCLQKDPSRRYQDYDSLIADLESLVREPATPPYRRPTLVASAAVGLVLVSVAVYLALNAAPRADARPAVERYFGTTYSDHGSSELLDFHFDDTGLQRFFRFPPSSERRADTQHPIVQGGRLEWQNFASPVPLPIYLEHFGEVVLRDLRFQGSPDFELVLGYDTTLPQQRLRIAFAVGERNDLRVVECYFNGERVEPELDASRVDFTVENGVPYNLTLRRRPTQGDRVPFEFVLEQAGNGRTSVRVALGFSIPESKLPRGGVALRCDGIRQPIWSVSVSQIMIRGQLNHDRIARERVRGAI